MIILEKTDVLTATEVSEKDERLGQHNSMSNEYEFDERYIIRVGAA
jgi:hypothetical protein